MRDGDYLYYTRHEDGKQYPIHCRRSGSMEGEEEILLDVNQLAEGYEFCQVGSHEVSADQSILAYTIDTQGRRIYTLRFRDLSTGQDLKDEVLEVTGNIAWAEDNRSLFYTKQDGETLRWYQIRRHILGTDSADDVLVYEGGKLLNKKNTFTDFIDCAEYLVAQGYTRREQLYAYGGSAGGLLMGAVMNMRPDLFHGVLAAVPFVDVVTTMLDESISLTTSEYDEWGNPNDEEYYRYILSYSPYDNVEAKGYPHLLVLAGLHDSQVQYWEPAKWVARLRAQKTGHNRLLMKTEMEAGHGGPSGRYRQYRESALLYSFILDLAAH